jgi:hypothetical protein
MLGTPGYLPIVVAASYDRVLVQTLPLALAVLIAVATPPKRETAPAFSPGAVSSATKGSVGQ